MRKSFFFSIIALAAVVSCSKSEVIDSKYGNDTIGFQTYIGRDAQTKAAVATEATLEADANGFGVYGFYTANEDYASTTPANLMNQIPVKYVAPTGDATTGTWEYTPAKYWANATDKYTFFAYYPTSVGTDTPAELSYTVDENIANQLDVLYSNNNLNITKRDVVGLNFKHALARITVKATATMYPQTEGGTDYDNTFHVKEITLKGAFNTAGTLQLAKNITEVAEGETKTKVAEAGWTPTTTATAAAPASYNFFTTSEDAVNVATEEKAVNYVSTEATDYGTIKDKNYLMVIPTDFKGTDTAPAEPATLVVRYSIMSAGVESTVMERELEIKENFEMGHAYSINIAFALDPKNMITFDVTDVEGWPAPETPVTPNPANPELVTPEAE